MKVTRVLFTFFSAAAIAAGLLSACQGTKEENESARPQEGLSMEEAIARGAYLVNAMGCEDCHSPKVFGPQGPQPDPKRHLAGHPQDEPLPPVDPELLKSPWVLFNMHSTATIGPWGTSFAANLTSDNTGIGLWTEEQFFRAIREGKYKGMANGRMLLPPMPWPNFARLSDEDLKSIFAYLKSTEPVRNIVPQPLPPVAMN